MPEVEPSDIEELRAVVEDGTITGFRQHGLQRALDHGITGAQIRDAVSDPLTDPIEDIDDAGRRAYSYIGSVVTVVLNDRGELVTTFKTNPGQVKYYERGRA